MYHMSKYIPERDRDRNREYLRRYRADPVNRDKMNARKREWRRRRAPEKTPASRAWEYHRMQPEDKAAMWQAQGGKCYLCGGDLSLEKAVIDHDHRCCPRRRNQSFSCPDCRRGLACNPCNLIVGHADDDPDRLRRIADALAAANLSVMQRLAARPPPVTLFEIEGDSDAGGI